MLAKGSTDTVIDDAIVAELKHDGKLKRGCGDPRPAIDVCLQMARVQAGTRKTYWAKAAKRDIERAKKALAILGRDYFDHVVIQRLQRAASRTVTARDPRADLLQDLCGGAAVFLVSGFSRRRLARTPDGVVHNIARLIFENATGTWPGKASLLQACRRALKEHSEVSQS
jgi:hypothetical protein